MLGQEPTEDMRSLSKEQPKKRWLMRTTWGLGFGVLLLAYLRASFNVPKNADCASILLEAQSILEGNLPLSGWWLSTVNYYFTDILFYVLGMAVAGLDPALMHVVPAMIYFVSVVLVLRLTLSVRAGTPWQGGLLAVVLAGLPSQIMPAHVFVGPVHLGTILLMLCSFVGLDAAYRRGRRRDYAVFFAFLAMAAFSDTLSVYIAAVPVMLYSAIYWIRGSADRAKHALIGLLSLLAVAAAVLGEKATNVLGGFVTGGVPSTSFVSLENLSQNVLLTLKGLLLIFGANFFGLPLGQGALGPLLHAGGLAVVGTATYLALRAWFKANPSHDHLSVILALGMTINLAAYTFSGLPVNEITSRYLTAIVFFGAILAGRRVTKLHVSRFKLTYLVPLLGLGYMISFVPVVTSPMAVPPERPMIEWLTSKGLRFGYGSFWSSANTTVQSKGETTVRQVIFSDGKMVPFHWLAHRDWYENAPPAHFVVLDPFNHGNVTLETAVQAFGNPNEIRNFGAHTVLVWDKDLTPLVTR